MNLFNLVYKCLKHNKKINKSIQRSINVLQLINKIEKMKFKSRNSFDKKEVNAVNKNS